MCVAAMRMSGISDIKFAYSNEQAEPFGLSTAAIAAELARPIDQQTGLSFKHWPTGDGTLYQVWQAHQSTRKMP